MPSTPCLHPGCGKLGKGSWCDAHRPERRPSPTSRDRPPKALRDRVKKRDGWRCVRCGSAEQLEVHHVLGVARGGTHDEANLVTLCRPCHRGEERR